MTECRPAFYDDFLCRARDCRHSCCRGWEIDVDPASAERYRSMPGPLGEALRAALAEGEDGWSFRLDAEERCPFLRADGLCRVILEAGEDALCDICALHPRFFSELGDYELCGLGLSCEAVCALLLDAQELRFLTDAGEDLSLSGLLLRLGIRLPDAALHWTPPTEKEYYVNILNCYAACEPIDAAWTEELEALRTVPEETLLREIAERDAAAYDRIFGYLLYRQLELVPRCGVGALLRYASDACAMILLRTSLWGDLPEQLRRWSEEVEYSTENVGLLTGGCGTE